MATWNDKLEEWEYIKGEHAWFVAGYERHGLIIIKVEILDTTLESRKLQGERAGFSYWIDEPSDYPTDPDSLFPTKDLAMEELEKRVDFHNREVRGEMNPRIRKPLRTIPYEPRLDQDRLKTMSRIESSWYENQWSDIHCGSPPRFPDYKVKRKWVDWFPPTTTPMK